MTTMQISSITTESIWIDRISLLFVISNSIILLFVLLFQFKNSKQKKNSTTKILNICAILTIILPIGYAIEESISSYTFTTIHIQTPLRSLHHTQYVTICTYHNNTNAITIINITKSKRRRNW